MRKYDLNRTKNCIPKGRWNIGNLIRQSSACWKAEETLQILSYEQSVAERSEDETFLGFQDQKGENLEIGHF